MKVMLTQNSAPTLRITLPGTLAAWLVRTCRLGLGVIFVWSGVAKLIEPQSFALTIGAFGLLPAQWIAPLAAALSLFEVAAGAGLLFDVRGSLEAITALLLLFTAILVYGLWLGLDIDCGCFGPGDPEGNAYHGLRPALYRDLVMLSAAGFLFYRRPRRSLKTVGLNP